MDEFTVNDGEFYFRFMIGLLLIILVVSQVDDNNKTKYSSNENTRPIIGK